MQKSLLAVFLAVLISTLILSALFDNVQLYILSQSNVQLTEQGNTSVPRDRQPVLDFPNLFPIEIPKLLFTVSPANPVLYWRIYTADFYTGLGWSITTTEEIVDEFSETAVSGGTKNFTVNLNTTSSKTMLPVPPSETNLTQPLVSPSMAFRLAQDKMADNYGIILGEPLQPLIGNASVVYQASYHFKQIDRNLISLADLPDDIKNVYLQAPTLPEEVVKLANELKDDSLNPLDQILKDINFFLTNFEYDINFKEGKSIRVIQEDWVASYLKWKKGICTDANTALTVILRLQGIPARITIGFKPSRVAEDKVYYYSDHAHAETEAYLPPYGWVRFDATPPGSDLEEISNLVKSGYTEYLTTTAERQLSLQVIPKNATGNLEETLRYQALVNNSRKSRDVLKIETHSEKGWDVKVVSRRLEIEAFQIGKTLIEVTLPADASEFEYDVITVVATSTLEPDLWASDTATAGVGEIDKVSTSLQISAPSITTDASVVQFTVSLSDDQGQPIKQGEIFVENYGVSLKTDNNGITAFSVDETRLWWKTFDLKASFKGSNRYEASSASTTVSVRPHILSFLIPFIFSGIVASAYILQTRKPKKLRRRMTLAKLEKPLLVRSLHKQAAVKRKSILNVLFPDIKETFPDVWGINEEIRIKCILDGQVAQKIWKGDAEIFVDKTRLAKDTLSLDHSVDVSYTFKKKGEHVVSAVFTDESNKIREISEKKIRIVDYREEIVRLYNVFLQRISQEGIELKENMTAREIEYKILRRGNFNPCNVREVTDCFEKAEYSNHSIMRGNYESMYLALKELQIDVS